LKTFHIGDRVVILSGKATGQIGIVECRTLAGGDENSYLVVLRKNGRPFRQRFNAEKLELHSSGGDGNA